MTKTILILFTLALATVALAEVDAETAAWEASAAPSLEKIFTSTAAALDELADPPKDSTQWHMEYFSTDLAVSASGALGVLTVKGTPSVQAFWRKQGRKPAPAIPAESGSEVNDDPIEPLVREAMASGKIRDEGMLRKSLNEAAAELQAVAESIDIDSASPWWVSGFRFDLSVSASGKVSVLPSAGADLRLRLDWKRLKRKAKPATKSLAASPVMRELKAFAEAIADDLALVDTSRLEDKGFRPFAFRAGLGMNAQGNFVLGKNAVTLLAHINFSRAATKPVVYPKRTPVDAPPGYAKDRERFRKGLAKAIRMGAFFGDRTKSAGSPGWNVYELKLGFDTSVLGDVALGKLGGIESFQMNFYNQDFDGKALAQADEAGPTDEAWFLRNFWFRAKAPIGITVPGVKVSVVPDVELLWQREIPDGWSNYKP